LNFAVRALDFPDIQAKGMFFNNPEGNLVELDLPQQRVGRNSIESKPVFICLGSEPTKLMGPPGR
jgi:hypothetical protein